ncbi:hypothetical protein LPJ53_003190 [Coemansia erecta]|uniref:Inositol-pentakisphosphate 2-kinase n=1 Tax=Coemansia erecta TaxID=147472 RepID=A0A9W8CS91_9FUNG|nr:hypothetical protein LPJ53_003190 [Coemansia erecta]
MSDIIGTRDQSSVRAYTQPLDIDLDANDWMYHHEGNENILFKYIGSSGGSHSMLQGQILRLQKHNVPISGASEDDGSSTSDSKMRERTLLQLYHDRSTFSHDVIGRLLGEKYILPQRLVRVSAYLISQLNAAAASQRPANRLHKQADVDQALGVLIPDMSGDGQRLSIEIKPKWGFLPTSRSVDPVKHRTCRYCMHKYLKHSADKASGFCPLDLYSGDSERVEQAVDALVANPQNNFRVFIDGNLVDSSPVQAVAHWDVFKSVLVGILVEDGVLPRLADLQRSLDRLDIEGVYPEYLAALRSGALSGAEPSIEDWVTACSTYISCEQDSVVSDKQAVLEFMLSVTLKDISMMIQIDSWPPQSLEDPKPSYSIAIVDTDAKKLSKMTMYLERDQAIVKNYLDLFPDTAQQTQCTE